jgi:exosome complex component CSL4
LDDNGVDKKKKDNNDDKENQKTQVIIPGDKLGVIEEYVPGQGTFTNDGNIISSVIGAKEISLKTRSISIVPARPLTMPALGSLVEGQVTGVQDKMANIRILKVGEKIPSGFFTGVIHISTASDDYVKVMSFVCKPGDIVRAKVVSDKNRTYQLSTAEKNLGVIHGFCSICGGSLIKKGRILQCDTCQNTEERKTANDYGNGA